MKKGLVAVLALMLLVSPVFAAQTQREVVDTTLNSSTHSATSDTLYIGDAEKVTFFITYDSSRVTAAITAAVTAAVSVDGTNWQDISWFDTAGGATPQTSETLSVDSTYAGWFAPGLTAPYIRIQALMSGAFVHTPNLYTPTDSAGITVTVVEKK